MGVTEKQPIPQEHHIERPGDWLPPDHRVHKDWLAKISKDAEASGQELHPVLKEFRDLVYNNTRLYILVTSMFDQIPKKKPYAKDPTGHKQVRDFDHCLILCNHILNQAPKWTDSAHNVGMVGVPFQAIMDWPIGTSAGYAVFLDPQVNAVVKKVLNVWGEYLQSPASASVLGTDHQSWFSPHGVQALTEVGNNGKTNYKFEEMFQCDPSKEHHGYTSWDNFFTRQYREGIRPIASPEDDNVICNACESKTYNIEHNVSARAKFWVKGQHYSVLDMLAHDEYAPQFVGGTIYQAFLSALSYHRWHAPVSGIIKKTKIIDGTYFSEPLFETLGDPNTQEIDEGSESTGQGYISATATRALIFIEADNPLIGLMCVIPIGMTEVSTCEVTVKEGDRVKKGDQLGMFHFGGSTHCLLFRKDVNVKGFPPKHPQHNVPVLSHLATVQAN